MAVHGKNITTEIRGTGESNLIGERPRYRPN